MTIVHDNITYRDCPVGEVESCKYTVERINRVSRVIRIRRKVGTTETWDIQFPVIVERAYRNITPSSKERLMNVVNDVVAKGADLWLYWNGFELDLTYYEGRS